MVFCIRPVKRLTSIPCSRLAKTPAIFETARTPPRGRAPQAVSHSAAIVGGSAAGGAIIGGLVGGGGQVYDRLTLKKRVVGWR
jgi:hypothetical protein